MNSNSTPNFLSRYKRDGKVLQKGDFKTGRASVSAATDIETGNRVIIKTWKRDSSVPDAEVQEIWVQEIRQLHRLLGYPGARDFFVSLIDSGKDKDGFYLILGTGQRVPLEVALSSTSGFQWLRRSRVDNNRLLIWKNLNRIASGLNLLHQQGLLHRNLDYFSIYTSGDGDEDFQLTGFEWSIRLSADARVALLKESIISKETNVHSFLQDWHAFGLLAAKLFEVDPLALIRKTKGETKDPAPHLIGVERELLLLLLRADPFVRLDGETVNNKLNIIIRDLESIITKKQETLFLTPALGPDSSLSKSIREASGREIDISDIEGQISFVRNDISENPQLILSASYAGEATKRYLLIGRNLNYRLSQYRNATGNNSQPSWNVAISDSAAEKLPVNSDIIGYKVLPKDFIEILPRYELNKRFPQIQGKAAQWDKQISLNEETLLDSDAIKNYKALFLVQILEALFTAAEVWPVEICHVEETEGRNQIHLKPRKDEEREKLSKALGLESIAVKMKEAFSGSSSLPDEDWKLTDTGVLGEKDDSYPDWKFMEIGDAPGKQPTYIFTGSTPVTMGEKLFLRRSGYLGTDRQLTRRVKALIALKEHSELLNTIEDPRGAVRPTHDIPLRDTNFQHLDDSKQDALNKIWASMPLFTLQGPPGVGKTRLVRELVRRKISEDPSSRILLSAQSHDAVDHLLAEIEKELVGLPNDIVVVRSRPKDDKRPATKFDLPTQTTNLIEKIAKSELLTELPKSLKAKFASFHSSLRQSENTSSTTEPNKFADRSVEGLLLRGANLVFASTNSGDLERLIVDRSQFDWAILEEAGKATGPELITPLLLSYRRLMIGDHKQLPPFGADRLKKVLSDPDSVREALKIGSSLVGRIFHEAGIGEIIDESLSAEEFPSICADAAEALMLFESLVEESLTKFGKTRLAVGERLSIQHRMHPAISKLVSSTFYDEKLFTDPKIIQKYTDESAPFIIPSKLNCFNAPIVFVDMPFVQSAMGRTRIEKPAYYNSDEIEAVFEILRKIKSTSSYKPSLAILTPYREQARRLKERFNDERINKLTNLNMFTFGESDNPVGTVDSFQGNEADLVIVSLVRNNERAGIKALGFLADPRRMNVLLSRAKWQLIIIGSHEFLKTRLTSNDDTNSDLQFLQKFLITLDEQTKHATLPSMKCDAVIKGFAEIKGAWL